MSRFDIIKRLKSKNPELNKSDLEDILDIFCDNIEKALLNNKKIEIRGFGTFFVKKIKEKHSARNPKTEELIYVPERKKIKFKPSKKLNYIINKWNQKYL